MDTFIGNIIIFCGTYAPNGWAFCNGSLLPISEYDALFALIGTTYGGDGQSTFALPDLRGRVPVGVGQGPGLPNVQIGETGGNESVILIPNNLPAHNHNVSIGVNTAIGDESSPTSFLASHAAGYSEESNAALGGVTVTPAGGSQPLAIRNPYLGVNYIISLYGIFPSQS
jgi:microcystin-dependent protein